MLLLEVQWTMFKWSTKQDDQHRQGKHHEVFGAMGFEGFVLASFHVKGEIRIPCFSMEMNGLTKPLKLEKKRQKSLPNNWDYLNIKALEKDTKIF